MDPTTPTPPSTTSSQSAPKLRLMCSYGGHIVPRPMDKTLCYAGGQTRIVAVDRRNAFSLSSLSAHISKSLLNGRPFCLKYQLPHHDLDSLISITTDEDLANMIDEYDRLLSSGSNTRLRFFLFTSSSGGGGNGLHDPTSEDWFIDALRNCGIGGGGGGKGDAGGGESGNLGASLAESIVLEKTSSFGSTSSSTSNSVSPAVRSAGGEEGGGGGVRLHDVNVLPTLDSIGSDCSIPSPNFSPQNIVFQDASGFVDSKPVLVNHVEAESNSCDRSPHSDLLTTVPVPSYIITKPMDQHLQPTPTPLPLPPHQPQYYHPASHSHYVTQYYPNHVPVASYPTVYQPYVQPQQPAQYQINRPYPVYMMPYGQTQNPYDMSTQCTIATVATTPIVAKDPQVPSSPVLVASPSVYEGYKPAIPTPDYAAKVYRTPAIVTQPSTVPSDDHHLHQQVVGFPPVSLPSQPVVSSVETTNCISDYEDPMHDQIYKTQPPGPTLTSQLQTAVNATLSDAFTQLHVDNKH